MVQPNDALSLSRGDPSSVTTTVTRHGLFAEALQPSVQLFIPLPGSILNPSSKPGALQLNVSTAFGQLAFAITLNSPLTLGVRSIRRITASIVIPAG
jgi:hypothetical protein